MQTIQRDTLAALILSTLLAISTGGCAATDEGGLSELDGVPTDPSSHDDPDGGSHERGRGRGDAPEAAEPGGSTDKALYPRLFAQQDLKIRGGFTEESTRIVAPNWSTTDEHGDPVMGDPLTPHNGRCSASYQKDYFTAYKTSGHGSCSAAWLTADPRDCRVEVTLNNSAGGDNIWNGNCMVRIFEKPAIIRANSCLNRCGNYNQSAICQCDRDCQNYGDCCPDRTDVCF